MKGGAPFSCHCTSQESRREKSIRKKGEQRGEVKAKYCTTVVIEREVEKDWKCAKPRSLARVAYIFELE